MPLRPGLAQRLLCVGGARPSGHAPQDLRLIAQLRLAHADSRQTYGRPRLCRALRARGIAVSGKRVARLMRVAGLRARGRRRFIGTTDSRHNFAIAPNRVRRRFRPRRVNRVWAADMRACRLHQGWCYLAVVLDLASRRVLGWAVGRPPAPDLALAALRPALPRVPKDASVLHHSDRGIPYASDRCPRLRGSRKLLKEGIVWLRGRDLHFMALPRSSMG